MRTRDEFKALVYEKCEFERKKLKKRRAGLAAALASLLPAAACIVIFAAVNLHKTDMLPPAQSSGSESDFTSGEKYSDKAPRAPEAVPPEVPESELLSFNGKTLVSVDITFLYGSGTFEPRRCAEKGKLTPFLERFKALLHNAKPADCNFPLSEPKAWRSAADCLIGSFTLNFSDGSSNTCTLYENDFFRVDNGEWLKAENDEAVYFTEMLKNFNNKN